MLSLVGLRPNRSILLNGEKLGKSEQNNKIKKKQQQKMNYSIDILTSNVLEYENVHFYVICCWYSTIVFNVLASAGQQVNWPPILLFTKCLYDELISMRTRAKSTTQTKARFVESRKQIVQWTVFQLNLGHFVRSFIHCCFHRKPTKNESNIKLHMSQQFKSSWASHYIRIQV